MCSLLIATLFNSKKASQKLLSNLRLRFTSDWCLQLGRDYHQTVPDLHLQSLTESGCRVTASAWQRPGTLCLTLYCHAGCEHEAD